jgi:hypothetical protein
MILVTVPEIQIVRCAGSEAGESPFDFAQDKQPAPTKT